MAEPPDSLSSRVSDRAAATPDELAAIVLSSPDAVFMTTLDGIILVWNPGAERIYGLPAAQAVGQNFSRLFPDQRVKANPELVAEIVAGRSVENIEVQRRRADGKLIDLVVTMSPVRRADGVVDRIASIVGDITPLKEAQRELSASLQRLRNAAFVDPLTGMLSRLGTVDRLQSIDPGARDITVLSLDVDEFGYFNTTFGHRFGDQVLTALAELFRSQAGDDDAVGRTAGDEFTIVAHGRGADYGMRLAEQIRDALGTWIEVAGRKVRVTVGIGVASAARVVPGLAEFLLRRADLARVEAKRGGHGTIKVYDAAIETRVAARVRLEERLHAAQAASDFSLVFQPICDARTGVVREVETLLRWTDSELGPVPPDEFIPAAERTGLIVPIGEWVLRQATAAFSSLGSAVDHVRLNVNVSPRQLIDGRFVDIVTQALADADLPADRLTLEVTESAIAESPLVIRERLGAIRALGIGLAVDDFGTGHSSLARLHALPFTTVKIDKSLVDEIGRAHGSDVIVDAVVGMAHGLGLSVVAEGVEGSDQLARLRTLHCDLIQGFLLHRPIPLNVLRELLSVEAHV